MASLDFPSSPTNGQTYSSAGITWTYDSTYTVWNVTSSGPVGYSGSQGYTGSKGDIGYSGSLGYTGSAGTNGTNGYNGSQGYTGSASTVIGYTGSKGDIGYTGSAGTNGTNGYTGSAGTTGYTGSLGYSGSAATINWMYKTANYTAVNNDGILADTTSASFTVTLPASPATGTYVSIVDVTSTFATNPLTVAGNGQTLQGLTYTSVVLNVTSAKVDLIYEGAYWAVATTSGTRGYTGSSGVGYTGSASTVVGYTGSLGYVGSQGYNGSAGYTGSVGYTGSLGYTGSKGDIGYTGSIPSALTATSLALGGATLGTNNLAVTGPSAFSSTVTHSGATTLSGALTYGGVTLSNAVTGTGSMVLSTSPQFATSVGIGMTPVNVLDITQSQNTTSQISLLNNSAGAAALALLNVTNGLTNVNLGLCGTGYTTNGTLVANRAFMFAAAAAGIAITASGGPVVFGSGSNTEVARFDTGGILGIGITPSAWGTFNAAQVGLLSLASYTNGDTDISSNLYYNAGWKYIGTGRSVQIKLDSSTGGGDIKFLVDATGGTAGGATAGSEAARIDSSGNLLVGTTTSSDRLVVNGNNGIRVSGISTGNRALYIPSGDILFDNPSARSEVRNDGNSASELRLSGRGFVTVYTGGSGLGTGSEKARITTDGLGIGGTPPSGVPLYVSSAGAYAYLNSTTGGYSSVTGFDNGTQRWSIGQSAFGGANGLQFFYGTTEGMRLDGSGSLLVGTTDQDANVGGASGAVCWVFRAGYGIRSSINTDSHYWNRYATGTLHAFRYDGTDVGSISVAASSTAYNTSSDARLKTNVSDAAPASALIDAIQVRQFDWKVDNSHQRYGMVAQELFEVAPEAVSVPADPEQMMGVDYSKLVPMLIKEVQSLRTRLAALENK